MNVVLDFDGVINSYTSGWKGYDVISDPPVDGIKEAIDEIRGAGYEVHVISTRCSTTKGMDAVQRYLKENDIHVDSIGCAKPPAVVYVDDRALCFDGHPETLLSKIKGFKPWNKKQPVV